MSEPSRSLGTILPFPDWRNARSDHQQSARGTTCLARSNNQLVHTLERINDVYRALLVGERIADVEEMLAEVANALMIAARAGDVGA
jgi:hypothetical protein